MDGLPGDVDFVAAFVGRERGLGLDRLLVGEVLDAETQDVVFGAVSADAWDWPMIVLSFGLSGLLAVTVVWLRSRPDAPAIARSTFRFLRRFTNVACIFLTAVFAPIAHALGVDLVGENTVIAAGCCGL